MGLVVAGAAIVGVARADGGPEPGAIFSAPGSGAAVGAGGPISVYDHGVGAVVELDAAHVEAEKARAAQAPGYRDAEGNPRYVLVWEHGELVPGPALTCTTVPGEPRECAIVEPGPDLPG